MKIILDQKSNVKSALHLGRSVHILSFYFEEGSQITCMWDLATLQILCPCRAISASAR